MHMVADRLDAAAERRDCGALVPVAQLPSDHAGQAALMGRREVRHVRP